MTFAPVGLAAAAWFAAALALLRTTGAAEPMRTSLAVYFGAYLMVVTPGKIGDISKAVALRERCGVPLARGASQR